MKAGTVAKVAGLVLLGLAAAVGLAFLLGVAVMSLWNWLMPAISGGALGPITYWQAVGLFVFCHLLFKSHIGAKCRCGHEKGHGRAHPHFAKRILLAVGGAGECCSDDADGGGEGAGQGEGV